jgi:hypothetical protein
MRELDKKGCDQISFTEVETVFHNNSILVEKMVLVRLMEAARTNGGSIFYISKFIWMLQEHTNPIHEDYKI